MTTATNQIRLPFDNLTKSGLRAMIKKFEKLECPIAEIIATNRGKRESGMLIKEFTFIFESGQKLLIRVKYDGTVFQVRLNNKVKPIKAVDNLDKAIGEMVDYIQENASAYEKNKTSKAKRKIHVTMPSIRTTRVEKIGQAKARQAEAQSISTGLAEELAAKTAAASDLQSKLDATLQNINIEQERTKVLQTEIDALKSAQEV